MLSSNAQQVCMYQYFLFNTSQLPYVYSGNLYNFMMSIINANFAFKKCIVENLETFVREINLIRYSCSLRLHAQLLSFYFEPFIS